MADVNTFALNESPGLFLGKDTNPGGVTSYGTSLIKWDWDCVRKGIQCAKSNMRIHQLWWPFKRSKIREQLKVPDEDDKKKIIQVAPINKLQVTTNNQQNEIHLKKELKKYQLSWVKI